MIKKRLLHHVIISVFSKPHDDKEKILVGLNVLSPVSIKELLEQEAAHDSDHEQTLHYRVKDVDLTVQKVETDDGKMIVYTLFFKKMHDTSIFAKKIVACMTPEEKKEYHAFPERLLDFEERLSLRLDKELLMNGTLSFSGLIKMATLPLPKVIIYII